MPRLEEKMKRVSENAAEQLPEEALEVMQEHTEELRDVYRNAFGVDLPEYNGDDSWTLPMPARYVVDPAGIVRWASVSPDHSRRPDPADTVAALRNLIEG